MTQIKRSVSLLIVSLFSILFLGLFVSAALEIDLKPVLSDSQGSIAKFLNDMNTSKNLSIILLGVLLWMILYTITKKIFNIESKIISVVISLMITALAFLYLPASFIEAIVLQYGVLGATILTVIPFAMILYFTASVSTNIFFSRVIWAFYILYYFSIFIYRIFANDAVLGWDSLPYIVAIIAGIFIFFKLSTIRNWIWKGELSAQEEQGIKDIQLRKLGRKLEREEVTARLKT